MTSACPPGAGRAGGLGFATGIALVGLALLLAMPTGVGGHLGAGFPGPRAPGFLFGAPPGSLSASSFPRGTGAAPPSDPGALPAALSVTSTVDLLSNSVLPGNVPIRYASGVSGIAYDAARDLVFVAGAQSNSVVAVDPSIGIVQAVDGPLPTGNATQPVATPTGLAFDAIDQQLFATDPTLAMVEVFNVSVSGPPLTYYTSIPLAIGSYPDAIVAVSAPDRIFVAEKANDVVVAIAGSNDSVIGSVSVGGGPIGLTYDPAQGLVYVANVVTNDLYWFTAAGLQPGTSKFSVRTGPTSIALNPTDDTIWVGNGVAITIVNSSTRASSFNATFPSGSQLSGLLWDPSLGEMLAANLPRGAVSYLNGTGSVVGAVTTGGAPTSMVLDSPDHEVEVLDPGSNDLVRISDLSESVVGTDSMGVAPGLSSFDPVTDRVEVPDTTSNRVLEVNARALSPSDTPRVRSVTVPGHPVATAFDPVLGAVLVALVGGTVVAFNATSGGILRTTDLGGAHTLVDILFADDQAFVTGSPNELWSLDPTTLNISASIALTTGASEPRLMTYAPGPQLLFVTLGSANEVAIINASRDLMNGRVPAGASPYGIAYDPVGRKLFVADSGAAQIDVLDASNGTPVGTLPAGTSPSDVLSVPGSPDVLVANTRSNSVTVLDSSTLSVAGTLPVDEYPTGLVFVNVTGDVLVSDVPDSALSVIPATASGGLPFQVALAISPNATDLGVAVGLTTTTSYPPWDFSYQYLDLPTGCPSANSSILHCTPSGFAGNFSPSVLVTSAGGDTTQVSATLVLNPLVAIVSFNASRSTVTLHVPVTFTVVAEGGTLPYSYTFPNLPPGCPTVTTAQFTCLPDESGTYLVSVLVVDRARLPATAQLNLTVNLPLIANPALSSSTVEVGERVQISSNVSEGTAPYTFQYSGLPPGCHSENASTISCVPTGAGSFSISVLVVDASGAFVNRTVSLDVRTPSAPATGPPLLEYAIAIGGILAVVVALVAVLFFRRRRPAAPADGGTGTEESGGPELYTTSSRSVPRLPVEPTGARGPEPEPSGPRYYAPSPEEEGPPASGPSGVPSAPAGTRPTLICRSCGTANEPWITHCRNCKRPLHST